MTRASVVMPAAGSGSRFKASAGNLAPEFEKKQFLLLDGLPVFLRALLPFFEFEVFKEWILVIDPQDLVEFQKYLSKEFLEKEHLPLKLLEVKLIDGGSERYLSVAKGVQQVNPQSDWIFVHDAARPLLHQEDLRHLIDCAQTKKMGYLPGEMLKDSVKRVDQNGYIIETPLRQELRAVSTPQLFPAKELKEAFQKTLLIKDFTPTDDAEVFTTWGGQVRVVAIKHTNAKVTTQEDWKRISEIHQANR